jgi:hypothetical protein
MFDIVTAAKETLGIEQVFYGDQDLIGATPAVAVETGPLTQTLAGVSYRTENTFVVFFLVYHGELRNKQATKKACEELAEAIRTEVNANLTLDGLVLQGNVTNIEPGYAIRSNTMMRTTRISWTGISKTRIA